MTVDSSALVAIVLGEANHLDLIDRILEAEHVRIGAPTLVEASIVLSARVGRPMQDVLAEILAELGVAIVPFGEAEWRLAHQAYLQFGRGRHPASLNFGDCLSYATARAARDTLLFVGRDFEKTDIPPA